MPFVTYYLLNGDTEIQLDILTEYPEPVKSWIRRGAVLRKMVPDDQKGKEVLT